jgi:hypothetical protein
VAAPEIASEYSQQIVETEHLLKALLEQPNGLARRVISKAGSDATRLLDKTDAFIRRQPRVSGDTAQQVGGWRCSWVKRSAVETQPFCVIRVWCAQMPGGGGRLSQRVISKDGSDALLLGKIGAFIRRQPVCRETQFSRWVVSGALGCHVNTWLRARPPTGSSSSLFLLCAAGAGSQSGERGQCCHRP